MMKSLTAFAVHVAKLAIKISPLAVHAMTLLLALMNSTAVTAELFR